MTKKNDIIKALDNLYNAKVNLGALLEREIESLVDYTACFWTGNENGFSWAYSEKEYDAKGFEYGAEVWGSITKIHGFTLVHLDHGCGGGPEFSIFDDEKEVTDDDA